MAARGPLAGLDNEPIARHDPELQGRRILPLTFHMLGATSMEQALFDGYRRRVVVPLVLRSALPAGGRVAGTRMNPVFEIAGQTVVLHPLDMVSVALEQLGPVVGSLAEQGQAISDALDELLTRSWG